MASSPTGQMPLIDHLRELRKRVLSSALAIAVAFGGGWYFYNSIIVTLAKPVCDLREAQASGAASCGALYISGVLGPLDLQIKVALMTAGPSLPLHFIEKRSAIAFSLSQPQPHSL